MLKKIRVTLVAEIEVDYAPCDSMTIEEAVEEIKYSFPELEGRGDISSVTTLGYSTDIIALDKE